MTGIELFEAIETCPTVRRLKEQPVEEEKIRRILEAANLASSGGNTQPWEFIVINDPQVKRSISVLATRGFKVLLDIGAMYPDSPSMQPGVQRSRRLIENYEKIPILVLACLDTKRVMTGIKLRYGAILKHVSKSSGLKKVQQLSNFASIFPALQNLILAARGLGLGTAISMPALIFERKLKRLLGIPPHVSPVIIVAVGYPEGKFFKPKRRPWTEMVHYNHW